MRTAAAAFGHCVRHVVDLAARRPRGHSRALTRDRSRARGDIIGYKGPRLFFLGMGATGRGHSTQRGSAQQGIIMSTRCKYVSTYMCATRARIFYAFGFACAFPLFARPRSYLLPRVLSCAPAFYEPCPTDAWQGGSRARAPPPLLYSPRVARASHESCKVTRRVDARPQCLVG